MKKAVFLILIIFTFAKMNGQSNVYHPFPTSNALWSETVTTGSGTYIYQYGIFGDTVFNLITYHKIYQRTIVCGDTTMSVSNSNLVGGIMEDTLKRVYYQSFNSSTFCGPDACYKLYNFSKQTPGDTIHTDSPCYPFPYLTINYVDSILINGSFRKEYHFLEGEIWIEGIGSLRSLLSIITPFPTCSCVNALHCYKQNDSLYYINSLYNYCYCDLGVGTNQIEEDNQVEIFPNPLAVSAVVSMPKNMVNATLVVYNSNGECIRKIKSINGKTIELDRGNLPSGFYFFQLFEANKIISSGKLIIISE